MSWLTWTPPVPVWIWLVLLVVFILWFWVWPVIREINWSWPR